MKGRSKSRGLPHPAQPGRPSTPPAVLLVAVACVLSPSVRPVKADATAFLSKPTAWFAGAEAAQVAANVLSFQSTLGGWPKNVDTTSRRFEGDRQQLQPTFDNGASTDELRFLARMCRATQEDGYAAAFLRGLDYVLAAQYANGGWPQHHPPGPDYHRHVTFNDGAMVRLMRFLDEVAHDDLYRFIGTERQESCRKAWTLGLECILKCQIQINGKPTVWCAQHDAVTLAPAAARTYELPSFSGGESASIVLLLMDVPNPSDRVKAAVRGAALWYARHQLRGVSLERRQLASAPRGYDVVMVDSQNAPPLWARFYDLATGQPFFCGRDGVKKASLADIDVERRTGYAWFGTWGRKVLETYPAWARRFGVPAELDSGAEVRSQDALQGSRPRGR